jgi:hypothetical protein
MWSAAQLTFGPGKQGPACLGTTGEWVYFTGETSEGHKRLFKVPAAGGRPVQVSDQPADGNVGFPMPDEKHVVLGSIRADGAHNILLLLESTDQVEKELPVAPTLESLCPTSDSRSMLIGDNRTGASNLWFWPQLDAAIAKQLTHFTSGAIGEVLYFKDGKRIAMVRSPNESNAVLFRSGK